MILGPKTVMDRFRGELRTEFLEKLWLAQSSATSSEAGEHFFEATKLLEGSSLSWMEVLHNPELDQMLESWDYGDRIQAVLDWAEGRPNFDTSFVESLSERYDRFGELTGNQEDALDRIIERFRINVRASQNG